MNHLDFGREGEVIAAEYLEKRGYKILEKNWRFKRLEVDLIALHGEFLVIVEVKTRKNADFGFPDESVSHRKIDFLAEAAAAYQEKKDMDIETRFDIVSIIMQDHIPKIYHIEEAFHP